MFLYFRSSTTQFIDDIDYRRLPGSVYSPDYEWDYPIPPPPATESRISVPYIRKEHDRYCKYYTVVKKKMQNLSSVGTRYQPGIGHVISLG